MRLDTMYAFLACILVRTPLRSSDASERAAREEDRARQIEGEARREAPGEAEDGRLHGLAVFELLGDI
jgi:hypothetical protein